MDLLIAEALKVKEAYDETIQNADRLFNLKYYENARDAYQQAAAAKPDEDYPKQKIKEINELLVQKNEFDDLVVKGDEFYMNKDLESAKSNYQEALKIYPSESYPRDMIDKINQALKSLKNTDELYQQALADADDFFKQNDYTNAIKEYENAAQIKPNEGLPKQKIAEINDLIARQEAAELEYNQAVQMGEQLLAKSDYQGAKTEFEKALSVRPDESYPRKKLAEIGEVLKEQGAVQESFDQSIAKADALFEKGEYDAAIKEYQNALVIIPAAPYATQKLEEIKTIKAEKAVQQKEYSQAIAEADKLFEKKDYAGARQKYSEASRIDDFQSYPQQKISEIEIILANRQELENDYNKAIATADIFMNNGEYESALAEYQKANSLKPSEKYPIEKIDEISKKLATQKDIEEEYNGLIASADQYYQSGDYERAKKDYQEAVELKPAEKYPSDQILLITQLQQDKQQTDAQYQQLIADADRFFKSDALEESKDKYTEALTLKPESVEASTKINEIEKILAERAALQKNYELTMAEADKYFNEGNYEKALQKYEAASKIKPAEEQSGIKIGEIEVLLAAKRSNEENYAKAIENGDKLLSKQDYKAARAEYEKALEYKPGESYPTEKLNEVTTILTTIEEQQNVYEQLIANADRLFAEAKYELAKTEYQKALDIKPEEKHPADRIREIEEILQKLDFTKRQYAETIAAADLLYNDGKYDQALDEYKTAGAIYPTEQYPKDRINEINGILAGQAAIEDQYNQAITEADNQYKQKYFEQALKRYQDAAQLKPDAKHPQERIAEISGMLAAINKENEDYQNAIKEGDNLFAMQQYSDAKLSFMKAANIKPNEDYPKNKMDEIDQLIANQKATEAEYNRLVAAADRMMESEEYDKAKLKYTESLAIKPNEPYPNNQLKKIDDIFLAKELATQEAYNTAISEADGLFAKEQYEPARIKYQAALKIKPNEEYPVQKIAEIEKLVSDFETLRANYNLLIADADKHFKAKEYDQAKAKYVQASALFTEEEYPINKIEEINLIFKAENERIQKAYDKAIADADKFFSSSAFDQALDSYRSAQFIKPDETYPGQMIEKIMVIMDKNAVRDLVKGTVNIDDQEIKKLEFSPVSVSDRKSNFIVIKAQNISGNEFKVVMSYGKGGSKNGGFVVPIPAGEDAKEYIIPVGKQYTWFSEDNDYISLVPEGGSVAVTILKISRGN
jgi:tetratricopeptide (TPR) repeat protein